MSHDNFVRGTLLADIEETQPISTLFSVVGADWASDRHIQYHVVHFAFPHKSGTSLR